MFKVVPSIYLVALGIQCASVFAWALLAGSVFKPVGDLALLVVIQLLAGGMSLGRPREVSRAGDFGWSFGVAAVWGTVGYEAYLMTSSGLSPGQPVLALPGFVAVVALLFLGKWLIDAVM